MAVVVQSQVDGRKQPLSRRRRLPQTLRIEVTYIRTLHNRDRHFVQLGAWRANSDVLESKRLPPFTRNQFKTVGDLLHAINVHFTLTKGKQDENIESYGKKSSKPIHIDTPLK
jgi:hypothetical protein